MTAERQRVTGATVAAGRAGPALRPEWTSRRERGSLPLLRAMTRLSLWLGRAPARVILYGIAGYFFLFAPADRRAMLDYLRRALGRAPSAADRFRLILSFASTIHDRLFLINERYDLFAITIEGTEVVRRRHERGEGAFLMGAHLGSFEVARSIGLQQPGLKVAMAMYPDNARKINAMLRAINPRLAPDVIPLGTLDAMLRIRARLDSGAFVGVLADRTLGEEPLERVTFLGAPAGFPGGAMRAAAMLRRPVIFMAGLYRGGNRYHVVFEELADFTHTPALERDAAVRAGVGRYAAILERYCRSDPYNWFNFFDFWH